MPTSKQLQQSQHSKPRRVGKWGVNELIERIKLQNILREDKDIDSAAPPLGSNNVSISNEIKVHDMNALLKSQRRIREGARKNKELTARLIFNVNVNIIKTLCIWILIPKSPTAVTPSAAGAAT